jgi:hypothetical protein
MTMGKAIQQLESLFLFVIALLTVVGAVKEIYLILGKRDVGLQDLLLMFLYVEVLGMVGIYLESVQQVHVVLQSLLNIKRMEASLTKASAILVRFSKSLASLRQRPSQAKVRSTTHRFGRILNPLA